jgi:hypothetical protein
MYKEDIFAFLDNVRESGRINMFGAAPVLQEVFGLDRRDARDMLREWMDTFAERNKVANGN